MLPSFLTVFLWGFTAVCAARSARFLGSVIANLLRLALAGVFLAIWAHGFGSGLRGQWVVWFVLSGCVGFGIGDIAAFEAMQQVGPRLTAVLTLCLSAPIGALIEWLWLGTDLTRTQMCWGLVILFGVVLALIPRDHLHLTRRQMWSGTLFGIVSALGQGGGAVLSRKGFDVVKAAGQSLDGGTAAYQRALGGIGIVFAFFLVMTLRERGKAGAERGPRDWRRGGPWMIAHALTGPTLGVSCFQWALATAPSGIVLPIVATTPLAVIPFAYLIEGDRPKLRSLLGGAIAVAGAVALACAP